jgi:hypothetical protein
MKTPMSTTHRDDVQVEIFATSTRLDEIRRELTVMPSWQRFGHLWEDRQRERHALLGKLEQLRSQSRERSASTN